MLEDDTGLASFEATRLRIARLRVRGGGSLKEVLAAACQAAAEALLVQRVGVWLASDDGRALHVYHQYDRVAGAEFEGAVLQEHDFPSYFRAIRSQRVLRIDDVAHDPVARELAPAYFLPAGIGASLDVPILLDGQVAGVVCHEHIGGARSFSDAECDLAVSHADMLATKIAVAAQHDAEARALELAQELASSRSRALAGQLAAGLAHDLANIFHIVRGNAELIAAEGDALLQSMARDIIDAAQRGSEIAGDLSALGRRNAQPRLVAVREQLVRAAQTLSRVIEPSRIALTGESLGKVLIDPTQLERVFLNLALNAAQAMSGGGVIEVDVSDVELAADAKPDAAAAASAAPTPRPGRYVLVKVRDAGSGMDHATRTRMFDPYFSTKPTGTGLGLAIVNDLVHRAGGFIHVHSALGAGTAIRIYLPRLA